VAGRAQPDFKKTWPHLPGDKKTVTGDVVGNAVQHRARRTAEVASSADQRVVFLARFLGVFVSWW
jgi:hypothetical protein